MTLAPVLLAAAFAAPQVRPLEAVREPDGGAAVYRDGDPEAIRGVDIYRAVLRLDLVDAYERKATLRKAAWIAAAAALVGGPALGYAFAAANAEPPLCPFTFPDCPPTVELAAANRRRDLRGLVIGAGIGAGVSAALVAAALTVHPHAPDYAEARDLVEDWNARLAAPRPAARGDGPRAPVLGLAPLSGGAAVSVALRW